MAFVMIGIKAFAAEGEEERVIAFGVKLCNQKEKVEPNRIYPIRGMSSLSH